MKQIYASKNKHKKWNDSDPSLHSSCMAMLWWFILRFVGQQCMNQFSTNFLWC